MARFVAYFLSRALLLSTAIRMASRKRTSAVATPPPPRAHAPKRAKGVPRSAKGCASCDAWQLYCEKLQEKLQEKLSEKETALDEKEKELDERHTATSIREETLAKRSEQLQHLETKLKETNEELKKRIAQVERESERVTPPSIIRQRTRRSKIEERMQLSATLNKLPREAAGGDVETVKEALARMGKYQDYNEGNGFVEAGLLYGGIDRFLEMFTPDENLTNITPVARLLDVIKNLKWKVTSESDDSAEDRAKTMLYAFCHRVCDRKTMAKVSKWLQSLENSLTKLTEDDLAELLFSELPDPVEEEEDGQSAVAVAAKFKPPAALHGVPDKLT